MGEGRPDDVPRQTFYGRIISERDPLPQKTWNPECRHHHETATRHQNVAVRIESEEIAEGLDSDDGTRDGIIFGNRLSEKDL